MSSFFDEMYSGKLQRNLTYRSLFFAKTQKIARYCVPYVRNIDRLMIDRGEPEIVPKMPEEFDKSLMEGDPTAQIKIPEAPPGSHSPMFHITKNPEE